jgi:prepilin-type N-terminal cleavage/methylation domain-containing protein
MLKRLKRLFGTGQDQGFTLIELLIVVLIVGILAAVATPLYLGYVKDAKSAEGKAVAGSLWTALQSDALSQCGTAVNADNSYPKAGLNSSGVTADGRWTASDPGSLNVNCTAGTYNASPTLFTITGSGSDLNFITIYMTYNSNKAQLQCDLGTGNNVPC